MSDNTHRAEGFTPNDVREFKITDELRDVSSFEKPAGGARRDRTDDLLLAKQALSQLSYGPFRDQASAVRYQGNVLPDP
jgi:hypothetical protein